MKVLITGANGYIGQRLVPVLTEQGHALYCCVRDRKRFDTSVLNEQSYVIEIDFLQPPPAGAIPEDIQVAFYLIHSMSSPGNFAEKEIVAARHFLQLIETTRCQQIIYLSGIVNEKVLSAHLQSRFKVEQVLRSSHIPATILRAGIIVGSGSASFEIIRDLVEKMPFLIGPKWLNTKCQPIAIRNVIQYLSGIMLKEKTFSKDFDIGGPEVLTYKKMLLQFAEVRKLKRWIFTVPFMSPRLSSYWLYFITSTSYPLTVNLVNSMKINIICRPNTLAEELGITLFTYKVAVQRAFKRISENMVISSWKDAFVSSNMSQQMIDYLMVPQHGCVSDKRYRCIEDRMEQVLNNIWSIGGQRGWYYGNAVWRMTGLLDKIAGGVSLHRGRTNPDKITAGDALDLWRVLVADKPGWRLLLFGEMVLPGEAWLEFKIVRKDEKWHLCQTATFRPLGLWGRFYWYSMMPLHALIFNGMINHLVGQEGKKKLVKLRNSSLMQAEKTGII